MIDAPGPFQSSGQTNAHEVRRLNELLRMAEAGSSLFGGDEDSEGFNGPHGQSISRQINNPRLESWWGILLNKGPNAEPDYTNARYWVRRTYFDQSNFDSQTIKYAAKLKEDTTLDERRWVTATNIDEINGETHVLNVLDPTAEKKPDSSKPDKDITRAVYVRVYCVLGACELDTPNKKPFKQYVFSRPIIGTIVTGKVTSNAVGKGKYYGKSFQPFTKHSGDVDPATDLIDTDMGTMSLTEDCLILNVVERGVSTTGHMVTEGTNTDQFAIYFIGVLQQINSDGKKVVRGQLYYAGC